MASIKVLTESEVSEFRKLRVAEMLELDDTLTKNIIFCAANIFGSTWIENILKKQRQWTIWNIKEIIRNMSNQGFNQFRDKIKDPQYCLVDILESVDSFIRELVLFMYSKEDEKDVLIPTSCISDFSVLTCWARAMVACLEFLGQYESEKYAILLEMIEDLEDLVEKENNDKKEK